MKSFVSIALKHVFKNWSAIVSKWRMLQRITGISVIARGLWWKCLTIYDGSADCGIRLGEWDSYACCACKTNYQCRLLLLGSTAPSACGCAVQTPPFIAKQAPYCAAWQRSLLCHKQSQSPIATMAYCNLLLRQWILMISICFRK